MAGCAAVVCNVRLGHKSFGQIFMAFSARVDIRFLSDSFGSG
jgi:hypothetical protein